MIILLCVFILQRPEEGLEHQEIMPIVPAPDKVGNHLGAITPPYVS